jgi:hypothetical protein
MKNALYILLLATLYTGVIASDIVLTWDANPIDENISSYRLYEQVGGGWTKIAETPLPSPAIIPTTLTVPRIGDGKHTFSVAAVNIYGEGPMSDPVAVSAKATKVKGIRVTTVTASVTVPTK